MDKNEQKPARPAWKNLPKDIKSRAIAEFIVYALLVLAALRSLSKRDAADLRGPKQMWKGMIPASIVTIKTDAAWVIPLGPLLYFAFGRRRSKVG